MRETMINIPNELQADVRDLIAEAIARSADLSADLQEAIRLAAEQPLSDEEARPLFTRIVTLLKGALDEGVSDERRAIITAEAQAVVEDLLAKRRINEVGARARKSRAAAQSNSHLELKPMRGLKVRPVAPVPVFNGRAIPMTEGYVPIEEIRLWPENHRLQLHVEAFRQANRRDPDADELIQILQGVLPVPGIDKKDPFEIKALADSIASRGVQVPPIIDWSGKPHDGNRRIAASLLVVHGPDYSPEQKALASWIRVWQAPENTTEDEFDAIVVALNFEKELKVPWEEYIKARLVTDHYNERYDTERTIPTVERERQLRRETAERFAIKPQEVTRYIKMVRWANEFEEHHRENRNRDDAGIRYRSNAMFQYFYELDAGRGDDKLAAKIQDDEAFKGLVFDLMYDGKFKSGAQIRHMRRVVDSEPAIQLVYDAQATTDHLRGQELIDEALDIARRDDVAIKKSTMKLWAKETVKRLDETAPSFWRDLDTVTLRELRRVLAAAQASVVAELIDRQAIPGERDVAE
jgi:hypothetical protein